jgi:hypothetical protein
MAIDCAFSGKGNVGDVLGKGNERASGGDVLGREMGMVCADGARMVTGSGAALASVAGPVYQVSAVDVPWHDSRFERSAARMTPW